MLAMKHLFWKQVWHTSGRLCTAYPKKTRALLPQSGLCSPQRAWFRPMFRAGQRMWNVENETPVLEKDIVLNAAQFGLLRQSRS
jgi:hypothetical protein